AVGLGRRIGQPLEYQPADDLAVLQDERHFPGPYLQDAAGRRRTALLIAETRVEEAGIVNAELADQRIERHHLGGIVRRDGDRLAAHQDVELVRIEDEVAGRVRLDRIPILVGRQRGALVD